MLTSRAWRLALVAVATLARAGAAQPEPTLTVADPGPGTPGKILQDVLSRRYIRRFEQWNTRFHRDSVFDTTVVVLLSDATVASTVHGDLVVIDGNIYLQPGAKIDGRAVAIGGFVYDSQQASARQRLSFPDAVFDTSTAPEGMTLRYRYPRPVAPELDSAELITLPYGLRWPNYDRVDGVSAGLGPRLDLDHDRYRLYPAVTYRSNLGAWDLSLRASIGFRGGWAILASGQRYTPSNDTWIQTNAANTVSTFERGADFRNYWRSDRFEARLMKTWTTSTRQIDVWGGGRTESDWSVEGGGPWSILARGDSSLMLRPNPPIDDGHVTSALVGGRAAWTDTSLTASVSLELEPVVDAPFDRHFTQATLAANLTIPTFNTSLGQQRLRILMHAVTTFGDSAVRQRYAYIGGSGSMPTLPILELGGDELVYLGGDYDFPLNFVRVPILGSPTFTIREMIASAGVGGLPDLDTNTGFRLSLTPFALDFFVNPANGDTVWRFEFMLVR